MINKIRNKIIYWQNILENQQKLYEFSKGHHYTIGASLAYMITG